MLSFFIHQLTIHLEALLVHLLQGLEFASVKVDFLVHIIQLLFQVIAEQCDHLGESTLNESFPG